MPAVSLTDLQQQITARERELQTLRQELESRQEHLIELTSRKEELQRQLQQIEEEITTLAATTSTVTEPSRPNAPASLPIPAPAASIKNQPRLGELILTMLREADGPRTARQLSEEAQKRGYQSQSKDPVNSVENRLQGLKSQGIVRRASGQRGYVLVFTGGAGQRKSNNRQSAQSNAQRDALKPAKAASVPKDSGGEGSSSSGVTQTAKPGSQGGQLPLHEMLTDILKNSRKLLSARELSEQILASGYQTDSENFVKVIGTKLWKMKNVQRVPGKGYRLKKKT